MELALDGKERLTSYIEQHLELFKTYTKSASDFTNRMRGKSFKHIIEVSALQKLGIEELKNEVHNLVIDKNIVNSNLMITNLRHVEAIKKAIEYANDAINGIKQGITLDVVSIDLKNLWLSLGEITGNNNNESIINEIFSGFCVGK